MKKPDKKRILNIITVCVTALAIVVGGNRVLEMITDPPEPFESVEVEGWHRFGSAGHRAGTSEATVVIVEFFDFTCPYCQEAALGLELLRDRYSEDVAVVYRHVVSNRPNSLLAAVTSECAARFGRFMQFHDAVMARRDSIGAKTWSAWAEQAGVPDTVAFGECVAETTGSPAIRRDTLAARELGVRATPTILVNDRMFEGYPGFDRLHDAVREAIRKSAEVDQPAVSSRDDADRQLPWRFGRVWQVSSLTHESLAAGTFAAKDVDAGGAGNVYLLDEIAATVLVISPDGEVIDSLGRTGSGPGEFCSPVALDVTADSILVVADYCGNRLLRWRVPDGQVLSAVPVKGAFNFAGLVRTTSEGFIATEMEASYGDGSTNLYAHHVTHLTSAGRERVFPGRESPRHRYAPCGRPMVYPKLFEPRVSWDYRQGVLAVAEDSAYVIHVFREGMPPARIEKDVLTRKVTASMARKELSGMTHWARIIDRCEVTMGQVLDGLGYTGYMQAVADVRVSPSGEIWALRAGIQAEPRVIDVFSDTGEHLGMLPPDSPFPAAFAPPDRIVAIERDEFGPVLTAYRISR